MFGAKRIDEIWSKAASVRGIKLTVEERVSLAIDLAALMLQAANKGLTAAEKRQQDLLMGMMKKPGGKAFAVAITDQGFRSHRPSRIADQLQYILKKMGIPGYLPWDKRLGLKGFKVSGGWMPGVLVPLVKWALRQEAASVILPGEPAALARHMERRRKEGVRINLNHLGEAILGEEEAGRRLKVYLEDLSHPDVEYISVKITTIFSQINLLAREKTLNILAGRLRELLKEADDHLFVKADGTELAKFVNLDMEEYKDLRLTVDVFKKVLQEPDFLHISAGIVLQSYLPDSFSVQKELTEWAKARIALGGAPIKLRIVKGANLGLEIVEASLKGWPLAPYESKELVDANFKRMVVYGAQKENIGCVHLGIASHNLFDIAYAYSLSLENEVEPFMCFEMLEGMADHVRRVVQSLSGDMLLYCPTATKDDFQHALAYLVRRLDENTGPDNFLRHMFSMVPGSEEWRLQAALFSDSAILADSLDSRSKRTQNRLDAHIESSSCANFSNEPDTDFALLKNQEWVKNILEKWSKHAFEDVPVVVGGSAAPGLKQCDGYDPSRPGKAIYRYSLLDKETLEKAIREAKKAQEWWSTTSPEERSDLLFQVAIGLRSARGDLIGAMIADTAKTVTEADGEVSEAIDFVEYYRRNIEELYGFQDIEWKAKGVALVASPWNFPCSIPVGGIVAALASGNSVLFKPAREAVFVGWLVANIFWNAGMSKEVLQFIPCEDETEGSSLIADKRVDVVILTGSTMTAKLFMSLRPGLDLIAETGGKNAIIVTALSDRDLAIKDIVWSAFTYSGQKCSACSLVILEAEVYDDIRFLNQLRDAVSSLSVGSAWDLSTKINPLIGKPGVSLLRGLTELEDGESWLLEPKRSLYNPQEWSPGIKLGVKPGSFMHQTELFGPVLGVMRAKNLEEAIEVANQTPYGLTSGLESLDEREQSLWLQKIISGNCYINRSITGAIVQRQPFGGCKSSSFGPGAKAGGPNYLSQLMIPQPARLPRERDHLNPVQARLRQLAETMLTATQFHEWDSALGSYAFFWNHYFSKDHDPTCLIGQDNLFSYRPYKSICVRFLKTDSFIDLMKILAVVATLGMTLEMSFDSLKENLLEQIKECLPSIIWIEESDEQWSNRLGACAYEKVRLLSNPASDIIHALGLSGIYIQVAPVLANGRLELLKFMREVSVSIDYHRYGNLGIREEEKRKKLH